MGQRAGARVHGCRSEGRFHGAWVEVRGQVPRHMGVEVRGQVPWHMGGGQRAGVTVHGWRSEGGCHRTWVEVRKQLSGITSTMGSRDQTQAVRSVGASLFPTKPNHET